MTTSSGPTNRNVQFGDLAVRHPDKTSYLARVFDDTTTSYKLIWFLSLLALLRRGEARSFSFDEIFREMAVIAWHPVCLYRLSLGRLDKLQDALLRLQRQSQLPANAAPDAIRASVEVSNEVRTMLEFLKRYVPVRFLSPWFADQLRGEKDCRRNRQIEILAQESQRTPFACPYWIGAHTINLNESWRVFLKENIAVVQGFTEYQLAQYLQARNPNVPGVVNKLRAPMVRQLNAARHFWRTIRDSLEKVGRAERFQDIYSEQPLGESFAIDHFLPWSYVTHDLLWNLTPVATSTNSKKGDVIPDLNLYLPRLAMFHLRAIRVAIQQPRLLEDYTDCFKLAPDGLIALGEEGFIEKYREVITPQAQIAVNQGFQCGWKLQN